jgi:very-short-patch-repair endonuclease
MVKFNTQAIISYYSVQFFETDIETVTIFSLHFLPISFFIHDFYCFGTKLRVFIGYLLLT